MTFPHPVSLIALFCLLLASPCRAARSAEGPEKPQLVGKKVHLNDDEQEKLRRWKAGETVSPQAVRCYGEWRCFSADTISNAVFARMWGKSYKKGCSIPRSKLRYVKVLHINGAGEIQLGELVCHADIAADLVSIFRDLYRASYPIARMVLIDNYGAQDRPSMEANNTSCFNYRTIAGTRKLSAHSRGRAIDINPLHNPSVKSRADGTFRVDPEKGRRYADRTKSFKYKISHNDLCYRLFKRHGFVWGGDWRSLKDYQHFEKP